jgi:hypothetical protein
MFKVLIACFDNWDTISEIPYLLKAAGCTIDAFCGDLSWLLNTDYIDNWFDSGEADSSFADRLLHHVKNNHYQWVILADDVIIKHMADAIHNQELCSMILPIGLIHNKALLSSKKGLSDFCLNNGIDTPRYAVYQHKNNIGQLITGLQFPLLTKQDLSYGGANMAMSHNLEELEQQIANSSGSTDILIQEFIEGEVICVEALFYKGHLLHYQSSNALEHASNEFSYTTRRKYYQNNAIAPLLIDLGKKMGLNAFANIRYIHDHKTGKYHLIEMDPRPNSWVAYSKFLGKEDFIAAVKKIVSGNYAFEFKAPKMNKPQIELALFYKDIRRISWKKDYQGLLSWVLNFKSYWKFIPLHDNALMRKIFKQFWIELVVFRFRDLKHKLHLGPSIQLGADPRFTKC